jgi:hypothetical protein
VWRLGLQALPESPEREARRGGQGVTLRYIHVSFLLRKVKLYFGDRVIILNDK